MIIIIIIITINYYYSHYFYGGIWKLFHIIITVRAFSESLSSIESALPLTQICFYPHLGQNILMYRWQH